MRLAQLTGEEKPRERLFRLGAESLSVVELLAILLRTGTRGEDVLALASSLLDEWGGLTGLGRAGPGRRNCRSGEGLKGRRRRPLPPRLSWGGEAL